MRARWLLTSLLLVGSLLIFVQADAPSLDTDGIHYGAVAKEIALSNRWLLPYDPVIAGDYYWHLHLSLWPPALLFKLLGVSPLTAKLYSMGMTLAALAGVFLLGRLLVSSWAGWCAGICLLATDHVLRIARQCRVDLPLLGFIVWAYVGLLRAQSGSRAWYLLAGAASLGAVMTKEIVGLVPLCTAAFYFLVMRKWKELFHPLFLACWAIALLPPLAVTGLEQALFQRTLWHKYLQENFMLLARAEHLTQPWYYYGWAVWDKYGYLLPLALPGAWFAWKEARSGREPRWILIFLWAAAFPVGFSLATHKVHYYILPTYAATALMAGLACDRWVTGAWRARIAAGVTVLASVGVAAVGFAAPLHKVRYEKNIRIAPRIDAILAEAPGEVIVIRQDVASLLFYSQARRITSAHDEYTFQSLLGEPTAHRRYCLVGYEDWKLFDPQVRSRWVALLDDGARLFLVERL